ncbi:redoxin domain-containing protein [Pelagibius sp.]|uniref:redoxin domain-containing protein n=1 Tax=Pelagibius sp. TaxID=1931238 RepID=UPI003BB04481
MHMASGGKDLKPFQSPERLEAGDRIRPFALPDQDGDPVHPLSDHLAGKPLILVFERNETAPSFAAEVRGLSTILVDASIDDVVVLAITRRSPADNKVLGDTEDLPYPLLSDSKAETYRAYGLETADASGSVTTFVLDTNLRLVALIDGGGASHGGEILNALETATADPTDVPLAGHPPVLVLPRVLSERDCADLIDYWHEPAPVWEAEGLNSRGFMEETGDFMVRNKDYGKVLQRVVRDVPLQKYLDTKLNRRVITEIRKAFQTKISRREEYRIAGYDAAEGGCLGPHRDNPTKETQHRRFTVSVALNGGAFEGGGLRFGEYSQQGYLVPTGTAIVWSCTLLHDVMPVTAGQRFILGTHLFGN